LSDKNEESSLSYLTSQFKVASGHPQKIDVISSLQLEAGYDIEVKIWSDLWSATHVSIRLSVTPQFPTKLGPCQRSGTVPGLLISGFQGLQSGETENIGYFPSFVVGHHGQSQEIVQSIVDI